MAHPRTRSSSRTWPVVSSAALLFRFMRMSWRQWPSMAAWPKAEQASLAPSRYSPYTLEDAGRFLCTTRRRTRLYTTSFQFNSSQYFHSRFLSYVGLHLHIP